MAAEIASSQTALLAMTAELLDTVNS